jgi:hypothetical protein
MAHDDRTDQAEAIRHRSGERVRAHNVAGAIRLAKELGPEHTIVTVLCDYAQRY